ncbi:MAG TPA: DUF1214 domain-containing protein [Vicinamibacterales bacterium]|nr:DUF1214 domain-containing protein [Vicinamibacterales bacterium]
MFTSACGGDAAKSPENEALYQKAYEAAIWATPILNSLQLRAELKKHGAKEGDLAFLGSRPNGRIELPTLNTTTPYAFGSGSLKGGPMVIDVPPASSRAKYFGSVMNIWDEPIEDFGPDGVDAGKGGKFVLLPPGSTDGAPAGYTSVQSSSYEFHLWLRSVPIRGGDDGWRDALEYLKSLKVYPLADAAKPSPTGWFDVSKVKGYFNGNPYFGQDSFRLIDEYVQNEPLQDADQAMHVTLGEIGIVKGTPFAPDAVTAKVLDRAARDAEQHMRGELESGRVFDPYWPDRRWGSFKPSDGADRRARAVNVSFFAAGIPRRSAGASGEPFAVMSSVDGRGHALDGSKRYRLRVPAKVPVKDFWSIVLYSTRSRSILDTEKFSLSSKDKLQINKDGSVDLYFSPLPPGERDANWLAIRPGETFFACVRFYGPMPALAKKAWILTDFEEVKK